MESVAMTKSGLKNDSIAVNGSSDNKGSSHYLKESAREPGLIEQLRDRP